MKWVDTTVHLKLRGDKERVEWMVSATESERAQKQQLAKDLESSKKVTDLLTAQIEGIQLECVSLRAAVEERTVGSTHGGTGRREGVEGSAGRYDF